MRRLSYVAGLAALGLLGEAAAGQPAALDEVLHRAGQYLLDYETRLGTVMAEEQYEQWIRNASGSIVARRRLTSEFLLTRIPDPEGGAWLGYRDVFLVDGRPVRERDGRLVAPLVSGMPDALDQLERIGAENARYNLGEVYRTINVPTLALDFLHPTYRARFSFRKSGETAIDRIRTWKIDYTERVLPSLIRRDRGRDRLARGSAWVEPLEGTVLRTELELGGEDAVEMLRSRITVDFRHEASLRIRVPSEMREVYEERTRQTHGRATYQNFRRFETSARIVPPR